MSNTSNASKNVKRFLLLFALGIAYGFMYVMPYMKSSFYDQMIAAMGPHVHSLCLFRVQQTDGGCGLDLLYHKCLSLYLLLHHLMITDIFCSSKMTFRYFRVRSKRQVFSLSKSG